MTYYNEFDGYAAQWLRNLMAAGHISEGMVDVRSITDVQPGDVPERAHFFAGIGGWEEALSIAGWPSDRPVWTGSCPCQPFSAAGKRKGVEDSRHLWPEFRRLIAERRPPVVFGEQVASADGRVWLAGVRSDLEALGYAVGAADLCSAGVGAPNIRQRLYWVASAIGERRDRIDPLLRAEETGWEPGDISEIAGGCGLGRMALSQGERCDGREGSTGEDGRPRIENSGDVGGLDNSTPNRRKHGPAQPAGHGAGKEAGEFRKLPCNRGDLGYWNDFDTIPCLDGKARRIEPGTFPLAHGVPGRVGRLRGYGNAINPYIAAQFIAAFLEAESPTLAAEPS